VGAMEGNSALFRVRASAGGKRGEVDGRNEREQKGGRGERT